MESAESLSLLERIENARKNCEKQRSGADSDDERRQLLLAKAGGRMLALDAGLLVELAVLTDVAVTEIPRLPRPFLGLARHRGRLLPVADLCEISGGVKARRSDSCRIVICRNTAEIFGLVVEDVIDIVEAQNSRLRELAHSDWGGEGLVSHVFSHGDSDYSLLNTQALWNHLRKKVPLRQGKRG